MHSPRSLQSRIRHTCAELQPTNGHITSFGAEGCTHRNIMCAFVGARGGIRTNSQNICKSNDLVAYCNSRLYTTAPKRFEKIFCERKNRNGEYILNKTVVGDADEEYPIEPRTCLHLNRHVPTALILCLSFVS